MEKICFHIYLVVKCVAFSLIYLFRKKIFLINVPEHTNLGDQAQFHCICKWITNEFRDYSLVTVPSLSVFPGFHSSLLIGVRAFIDTLAYMSVKFALRKNDIVICHSGYLFVDHHSGWPTVARVIIENPFAKVVILPQTFNFHTPVVRQFVAKTFSSENVFLACRDKVSFHAASELLLKANICCYPDVVTTLIGTRTYRGERKGVLFCIRNDIEGHYSIGAIESLRDYFCDYPTQIVDTDVKTSRFKLNSRRHKMIDDMIEMLSKYKVIITDRYHGTIFSLIASTPVVIIDSADHKLSSGVNWFKNHSFEGYVHFASNLEEAKLIAERLLSTNCEYNLTSSFGEEHWRALGSEIKDVFLVNS